MLVLRMCLVPVQEARDGREVLRGNLWDRGDHNSSQLRCPIIAGWDNVRARMGSNGQAPCNEALACASLLAHSQGARDRERGAWLTAHVMLTCRAS